MKDLYSFDRDEEGLAESYRKMYEAYRRAFARCGLSTRVVEADPGAIGGTTTHEFMVLADAGEAEIVFCSACDYAANVEKAECPPPPEADARPEEAGAPVPPVEEVATPGVRTIDELARFLNVEPTRVLKTMLYVADGEPVAVVVRGDHHVNEVKVRRLLGATELEPASPERIRGLTGAEVGFAGPVGLTGVRIIADRWALLDDAVAGANRTDAHVVHVSYGRDWEGEPADVRTAVAGDPCPRCGGELLSRHGIEVGQLFKLGTKYSSALGATFLDDDGVRRPIVMGCYGIGVSRTLAAIVEQHHDEAGIKWPVSVAPYEVVIVPVRYEDPAQKEVADEVYHHLAAAGVEVVLDDRDERAGVKFKDADLIGFPLRITVGPKALQEGAVEFRWRQDGTQELVALPDVVAHVLAGLRDRVPVPDEDEEGSDR